MFWQENNADKTFQVPDDIIDVVYKINCKCLPLEHAKALSMAIQKAMPWIADEENAGIHLIHGAESGNGWMRPEDPVNELLYLSKRSKMTLRIPKERLDDAYKLTGQKLKIDDHALEVGVATRKLLSTQSTLFSRYVVSTENETEDDFLQRVYQELQELDIKINKLLCGKTHVLQGHYGDIFTRSIMLAELKPQESVRIQQYGIGEGRQLGCGLFIPHKGIAAVKEAEEDV